MTKEAVLNNIDFKELSKSCKTQDDISNLTKEFMKNMIENMLKAEIDEFETYPKFCVWDIIAKNFHTSTPKSNLETNNWF